MPDPVKETFEELNKGVIDLREYVDKELAEVRKKGESSALTKEEVEKVNAEVTELRQKYSDLLVKVDRPDIDKSDDDEPTKEDELKELRNSAYSKYLRHGLGETATASMKPEEVRALTSSSDSEGGFMVPDDVSSQILMDAFDMGEIRQVANVQPTSRDAVTAPVMSKPVVAWGHLDVAVDPQDLNAGRERIPITPLRALALIDNDTLDDSAADIVGRLSGAFSEAVAEAEDDAFAAGAGDDNPQGVVANTAVQANYVFTGVAAALSDSSNNGIDPLIDALHKLKKTYRRNATWAMNSLTEAAVRKLKDGDGQYLWQPPVQAGSPPTLLGRPTINPEGLPNVAANAFPIVVGDWSRYWIYDRAGISVQRLVERYAEFNQVGFLLRRRVGGHVVRSEAFVPIKVATS